MVQMLRQSQMSAPDHFTPFKMLFWVCLCVWVSVWAETGSLLPNLYLKCKIKYFWYCVADQLNFLIEIHFFVLIFVKLNDSTWCKCCVTWEFWPQASMESFSSSWDRTKILSSTAPKRQTRIISRNHKGFILHVSNCCRQICQIFLSYCCVEMCFSPVHAE